MNFYSTVNWITAIIFAAFGILLGSGARTPSSRVYSLIAWSLALWSCGVALLVGGANEDMALFWSRFNHFVGSLIGPLFLYFTLLYPEEFRPHKAVATGLFLIEIGLAYLYFGTDLIIANAYALYDASLELAWSFGTAWYLFPLTFLLPFTGGFLVLTAKARRLGASPEATRIWYILGGTLLSAVFGMAVNVFLPASGIFEYSWLGPPLTIVWVAIMTYIIQKYQVLSVRVLAAVLLVLALLVILFLNIFAY